MAILPILRFPHEVLAIDCGLVREITPDIERLVQDMIETMHAAPGVGLAANQVGVALKVAVVDLSAGERPGEVLVLINPRVVENSGAGSPIARIGNSFRNTVLVTSLTIPLTDMPLR